jgi:hypothetical protein
VSIALHVLRVFTEQSAPTSLERLASLGQLAVSSCSPEQCGMALSRSLLLSISLAVFATVDHSLSLSLSLSLSSFRSLPLIHSQPRLRNVVTSSLLPIHTMCTAYCPAAGQSLVCLRPRLHLVLGILRGMSRLTLQQRQAIASVSTIDLRSIQVHSTTATS